MNDRASRTLGPSGLFARMALALTCVVVLSLGCDMHSPTDPGVLALITVTPNVTLAPGGTQQFTAAGSDIDGIAVAITPVWSVIAGGGTINGTGFFTAGATPGVYTATVQAASDGMSGTANVTVIVGVLATITVTPNPDTLAQGGTRQFTAVGRDASNNVIAITPVWSVVASGGSINAGGLFTAGVVDGTFNNTVRATSGSIFGSATVVVDAAFIPPPVIPLGLVAPYGIMAGLSFTCITGGLISADIAISPGSTVTGFPPCVITGVQHLADATALNAQNDLTTLYNTLFAEPCPPANAIVADLGGTTKPAGVYCTATSIGVTGTLTLDGGGDSNALFVFQAGSSIVTAGDVVLINGAQAQNVYWVSGSSITLGTASQMQGNMVALTSITLVDTANLLGRALARNGSVSLGTNNTITLP
jgi:hypothetical protein